MRTLHARPVLAVILVVLLVLSLTGVALAGDLCCPGGRSVSRSCRGESAKIKQDVCCPQIQSGGIKCYEGEGTGEALDCCPEACLDAKGQKCDRSKCCPPAACKTKGCTPARDCCPSQKASPTVI
jgi:hypothetical protein